MSIQMVDRMSDSEEELEDVFKVDSSSEEEYISTPKFCRDCKLPMAGHPRIGHKIDHDPKKINKFVQKLKQTEQLPEDYVFPKLKPKKKKRRRKVKNDMSNFDSNQVQERHIEDKVTKFPKPKPKPTSQPSILGKRKRSDDDSVVLPPLKMIKTVREEAEEIRIIASDPPSDIQTYKRLLQDSCISQTIFGDAKKDVQDKIDRFVKARDDSDKIQEEMKRKEKGFEEYQARHKSEMLELSNSKSIYDLRAEENICYLQEEVEEMNEMIEKISCCCCSEVLAEEHITPSGIFTCECFIRVCWSCAHAIRTCPKPECKKELLL